MSEATTSINVADVLAVDAAVQAASGSDTYGLTRNGFLPKPFARILAEKIALANTLFGGSIDLTSGSAIRKILEVQSLEDARQWAFLAAMRDDCHVVSASSDALSRLGRELGLKRPNLEARGKIKLTLVGDLPAGTTQITIPRGARLSTPGGHHLATAETVILSKAAKERDVPVTAFYPGAEHNLNPAVPAQKIDRWNRLDPFLRELDEAEKKASAKLVNIGHTEALTGGELQWPDARYRDLLLRAPRSVWTAGAIEIAVALVPGVRQAAIRDPFGGLDINQSVFGNFNFIERLFAVERNLASPYYFTILVAPTLEAIWDGPDGLEANIANEIEDLRPIGIFPQIMQAEQIGIGVRANLIVEGLPLPTGSKDKVNASAAAVSLKERLLTRMSRYVDSLRFGEPVRASEIVWSMMNEPGVADVLDLQLVRYPPGFDSIRFSQAAPAGIQVLGKNENVSVQTNQIPVSVDEPSGLQII